MKIQKPTADTERYATLEKLKENLIDSIRERKEEEKREKEEKNKPKGRGRPLGSKDKYDYYRVDPKITEYMLTAFDEGESKAQVAAKLGISSKKLERWRKDPDFNAAYELGFTRGMAVWDDNGKKIALGEIAGNAPVYTFTRKILHGYRDNEPFESKIDNENESLSKLKELAESFVEAHKKDV